MVIYDKMYHTEMLLFVACLTQIVTLNHVLRVEGFLSTVIAVPVECGRKH